MKRLDPTKIAAAGGLIAGISLTLTSFVRSTYTLAILVCIFGIGQGMVVIPAAVRIHQHFGDQFPAAFSFVVVGALLGCIVLPLITAVFLDAYGVMGALLLLGAICLNMFPIGLVLKPPRHMRPSIPPAAERLKANGVAIKPNDPEEGDFVLANDAKGNSYTAKDANNPGHQSAVDSDTSESSNASPEGEGTCKLIRKTRISYRNGEGMLSGADEGSSESGTLSISSLPDKEGASSARVGDLKSDDPSSCPSGCAAILFRASESAKSYAKEAKFFLSFMLPIDFLVSFVFQSWLIFMVPYAVSVGFDQLRAVLIATMGAVGGVFVRLNSSIILHLRPKWCPHYFILLSSLTSLILFLQPLRASYGYLLACSFIVGGSLCGAAGLIEPMLALVVLDDRFPTSISISYFFKGISALFTCYISGWLYDVTGSFRMSYFILGGCQASIVVLLIALIITMRQK